MLDDKRKTIFETPPALRALVASQELMKTYDWENDCETTVKFLLPTLSWWDVLYRAEHAPLFLPGVKIEKISSNCKDASAPWR